MPDTADFAGPSPKRRRTDSRHPISSEQIVQANATLSHFTGQRQNRWMQGYAASDGDGYDTEAASTRTSSRQTGSVATRAVGTRSLSENMTSRSATNVNQSNLEARANRQQSVHAEGTREDVRGGNGVTVDYESPFAFSSSSSLSANGRNPMDRGTSMQNPGLPSPAPSDETANSPVTAHTMEPPKRGRGRPRKGPPPILPLPSNGHPASTSAEQQQQPQVQQRSPSEGRTAPPNVNSDMHQSTHQAPSPVHGQGSSAAPSQSSSGSLIHLFHPTALKARIDEIERSHMATQRPADVDIGRLALLRDAVWPQIDWFYLALSQVHALMDYQPGNLPAPIRTLPPDCWKSLDDLVCSNKVVTPNLLAWLAKFPMPISAIYSDAAMSTAYNAYINAVASFLRELPAKWTELVAHCRRQNAPPLAQDLSVALKLNSSVLQTVAFRAIARMIYTGNDARVCEYLEHLHRLDQQQMAGGVFRLPANKTIAYRAFGRVHGAWVQWLNSCQMHEAQQRHLPEMSRTRFPDFSPSWAAPDALAVFQAPQQRRTDLSAFPLPSNAFTPQQTASALQQQQQAMFANDQRGMNQPRVNLLSPSPANLTPRPALAPGFQVPMPAQRHPQNSRFLMFPHENDGPRSQPTEPNATRSALHEAHLRSPVAVPLQIGDEMPQLYRYVFKYALTPTRLDKDRPLSYVTFDLPKQEFDKIPKTIASRNPGELPNQILSESSQTYRLRCCALPPKGFTNESAWMLADTHWPHDLFLELNGQMLEPRRPLHHKKFLPIDLTKFIKPGMNEIKVAITRTSTDTRAFDFALGVEVVGAVSHSTLTTRLHGAQAISAATTKASIQQALSGAGGGDDDDEVAITSTSMTIKLFDPFSGSKIFSIPVRGANCRHKDCFDLETFLSQCKRDKPGYPTVVDCWRCPLCRHDVRPSVMVRDEWLVDVRRKLEKQGKLDTRAIVVEADGSWRPKPEEKTGVRSASLEREERGVSAGVKKAKSSEGTPVPKKVIEIIELD